MPKPEKMYETGRAFTYLLPVLKESVANDVIMCHCLLASVKRLIKEFPNKKWSKHGLEDFQKRFRTTGSIERAPGSGRPRTTRTSENADVVGDLVQSQENQSQTHSSTRQISQELGIPHTNNWT